jgi:hypothetical protein
MGCVKETECDMIVSYTTRNNSTAADYPEIFRLVPIRNTESDTTLGVIVQTK